MRSWQSTIFESITSNLSLRSIIVREIHLLNPKPESYERKEAFKSCQYPGLAQSIQHYSIPTSFLFLGSLLYGCGIDGFRFPLLPAFP